MARWSPRCSDRETRRRGGAVTSGSSTGSSSDSINAGNGFWAAPWTGPVCWPGTNPNSLVTNSGPVGVRGLAQDQASDPAAHRWVHRPRLHRRKRRRAPLPVVVAKDSTDWRHDRRRSSSSLPLYPHPDVRRRQNAGIRGSPPRSGSKSIGCPFPIQTAPGPTTEVVESCCSQRQQTPTLGCLLLLPPLAALR